MKYGCIVITSAARGPSFGLGVLPTGTVMLSPSSSIGILSRIDDTSAGTDDTFIDGICVYTFAAITIVYEQNAS